jgi:hypothetical protein
LRGTFARYGDSAISRLIHSYLRNWNRINGRISLIVPRKFTSGLFSDSFRIRGIEQIGKGDVLPLRVPDKVS